MSPGCLVCRAAASAWVTCWWNTVNRIRHPCVPWVCLNCGTATVYCTSRARKRPTTRILVSHCAVWLLPSSVSLLRHGPFRTDHCDPMKQKTFQNNQAQHILLLAQIDGGQTTSSLVFSQRAIVVRWGWKQEKVSFRYRWQDDRKGRSCFGYTISQSSVYSGKSSSCEILLFPAACSHPQLIPLGVPLYFSLAIIFYI